MLTGQRVEVTCDRSTESHSRGFVPGNNITFFIFTKSVKKIGFWCYIRFLLWKLAMILDWIDSKPTYVAFQRWKVMKTGEVQSKVRTDGRVFHRRCPSTIRDSICWAIMFEWYVLCHLQKRVDFLRWRRSIENICIEKSVIFVHFHFWQKKRKKNGRFATKASHLCTIRFVKVISLSCCT